MPVAPAAQFLGYAGNERTFTCRGRPHLPDQLHDLGAQPTALVVAGPGVVQQLGVAVVARQHLALGEVHHLPPEVLELRRQRFGNRGH